MKILAVTSHYPPYHVGGYELRCKNVLDALRERGHEIKVIVSSKMNPVYDRPSTAEDNIYRKLHLTNSSNSKLKRLIYDYIDVKFFHFMINSFRPNLIYLWQTTGITKAIFPYLADCNISIVYDEGDTGLINSWFYRGTWFSYIESKSNSKIKNAIKVFFARIVNIISGDLIKEQWGWPEKKMWVYFNSNLGKRKALSHQIPVDDATIIYSGIDMSQFSFRSRTKLSLPIQIIVPGRIEPQKGQIDSVFLLSFLHKMRIEANLIIAGMNNNDSYHHEILESINELGLKKHINIIPMIDQSELVKLYQESDICFFSSYRNSGLSRIPLEAIACGCLVFSYGNEGSDEIIVNNKLGYIISPKDFQGIANIIHELISDPLLYQEIIANAAQFVTREYDLKTYVDKIENYLINTVR